MKYEVCKFLDSLNLAISFQIDSLKKKVVSVQKKYHIIVKYTTNTQLNVTKWQILKKILSICR